MPYDNTKVNQGEQTPESYSQLQSFVQQEQIQQLGQVANLKDSQPIRSVCFSPNNNEFFVLGTNSKSLKFCKLPANLNKSIAY